MDDYRKTKKRLFSIFENAKKRKDLKEASYSNKKYIPPDSPNIGPCDFEDTKTISTPQKLKAKISKSPSFTERIDKYFVNQPSSVSNEKLRNSCDTVSGVPGNGEHKIDDTENIKDDDDLEDSFVSDTFLDTIDTNAIVDMINTTGIFEKESQVQNANIKKYDSNSKENFKPPVSSKTKMGNVSCRESSNLPKTITQSNISKKSKKGIEISALHSLKTGVSSPVKKPSMKNTTAFSNKMKELVQ